ncbi:TraB/GumN family protein [Erythrobacter sp. EC-HK427]|uniref:TraB/GumN family protein n=1 Tax=Erythrobacter sp. EC-HK427 TaxID=2038396 RepID=UPI0018FE4984|nr:TraB/GumN family protein [Erythrobacter sp. EC-HK427]
MLRTFLAPALAPVLAAFLLLPHAAAAQETQANPYGFTQDYDPDPAMWVLADEDTTIYMLGTFHALPRGFEWRSERLESVIAEADALYLETTDFDLSLEAVDVDTKLVERLSRRELTSDRLSAEGAERWRQLVHLSGQDFATVDEMPLLLALLTMGTITGEAAFASSYLYGVETVLEREFRASNRPIFAIEDSGAVMYSLIRMDGDNLLAELDSRLQAWDGKQVASFYDADYVEVTGDAFWEAEHNWARGIVADDFDLGFGDGAINDAFSVNLLDRRNAQWAEWVEAKLEEPGTILLAVGAGHFEGDASLLEMLEARGLVAQRIE